MDGLRESTLSCAGEAEEDFQGMLGVYSQKALASSYHDHGVYHGRVNYLGHDNRSCAPLSTQMVLLIRKILTGRNMAIIIFHTKSNRLKTCCRTYPLASRTLNPFNLVRLSKSRVRSRS